MAPNRRTFGLEMICVSEPCPSHFMIGVGEVPDFWDGKSTAGHFHHVMLLLDQHNGGGYPICPHCQRPGRTLRKVSATNRFALGRVTLGDELHDWLNETSATERALRRKRIEDRLERYVRGEFVDKDAEDRRVNERIVADEQRLQTEDPPYRQRIFSTFTIADQLCYALTEAGRHVTTIALMREY